MFILEAEGSEKPKQCVVTLSVLVLPLVSTDMNRLEPNVPA